jgi:hypothetical protein
MTGVTIPVRNRDEPHSLDLIDETRRNVDRSVSFAVPVVNDFQSSVPVDADSDSILAVDYSKPRSERCNQPHDKTSGPHDVVDLDGNVWTVGGSNKLAERLAHGDI